MKILNILLVIVLFIVVCWYVFIRRSENDKFFNKQICHTKKIKITGVITGLGGHGIYQWISIDNLDKNIDVRIAKVKRRKGFPDNYDYQIGDSLIKAANSNEFTIKRDTNIVVYILDCDDSYP